MCINDKIYSVDQEKQLLFVLSGEKSANEFVGNNFDGLSNIITLDKDRKFDISKIDSTRLIVGPVRCSQCIAIPGLGFRRGSYRCVCKRGFYYPDTKSDKRYYNGTVIEEEYEKLMMVSGLKPN